MGVICLGFDLKLFIFMLFALIIKKKNSNVNAKKWIHH